MEVDVEYSTSLLLGVSKVSWSSGRVLEICDDISLHFSILKEAAV
jgi:hypothetical protein